MGHRTNQFRTTNARATTVRPTRTPQDTFTPRAVKNHQNPQNEGVQESYVGGERKKPAHGLRLSSTTVAEEGSDSSPFR